MTLARWYNRSALTLVVLGVLAYSVAAESPEFAVLAGPTVVMLWRLSTRRGSGGVGSGGRFLLPRFVVNILLFAVLGFAILRAQGRLEVETIAQVVVLIQIIKIGDRRAPRDDAQILSLAVFLAIAAMLDSNSLWTGVILVVFLPLLILTVMLFQLHKGAVHAAESGGSGPETSVSTFRRGLRWTSGIATVGTLGLSVFVFVLMPRGVGENVFGSFGTTPRGQRTGFTSSVTLGSQGILSESQAIVLDLVVKDSTGQNIGSPDSSYYLRGAVLTEYQNSKWTAAEPRRGQATLFSPGTDIPVKMRRGAVIEQTVSVRGNSRASNRSQWQPVFAIWAPAQVRFQGTGRFRTGESGILERRSDSSLLDYTVWSVPFELAPVDPPVQERQVFDVESERIRDLAVQILTRAGIEADPNVRSIDEDARAARAIQDYLRSSMTYTLEMEAPPRGVDPVEHFLFDRKQGHCEYMASAMVLLCRAVGINARMVTGYVATEFSTTTGAYTVREANAHAWVEVEDVGARWRLFDPTPPAALDRIHRAAPGLMGRLRQALEAMEYAWNSSFVAFNEQTRQSLLGPNQEENPGFLGRVERFSQRMRAGGPRLMVNALASGLVVFAAVASLGIAFQVLLRMALGRGRSGPRGMRRRGVASPRGEISTGAYAWMLRWLQKRGLGKPEWRPPLAHAAELSGIDAQLAADVERVTRAMYREVYRGESVSGEERRELESAARRVRDWRRRTRES